MLKACFRGLRQQAALTLLRSFCGQPASDRTTASRALVCWALWSQDTDNTQPRAVCDAVQHLQVKKNKDLQDETNYYELHTILSLIDLCIINQPLNATGMVSPMQERGATPRNIAFDTARRNM